MLLWARAAALLPAICLLALPLRAEVYTWTDGQGGVHMTDDLSKVPAPYRRRAEETGREKIEDPRAWNAVAPGAGRDPKASPAAIRKRSAGKSRKHVLGVSVAGREMRVTADLDGTRVPFVVDTGAMSCTIPMWAVREMGIEFDDETPRIMVTGISGQAMMVPVITVGTVRVGSAEVEDVEMAVLDTQNTGLLGMTFFNHFKVSTDPARGVLTLEEIDLNAVEGVYGGLGERAWRNKFAYLNWMLAKVESYRGNPQSYPELEAELDRMEEYWEGQLDALELKASRAGVPRAWRE